MAFDIALDTKTGDVAFTPNLDFQGVRGSQVVAQRLMARLLIERGWEGDPTGALGSRLRDALRMPRDRALRELRLYVEEALAPMEDISISSIDVEEADDPRSARISLSYTVIEPGDLPALDIQVEEQLTFDVPV